MAGETKVCPLCAETIKAAAKVCPFCQTRLNWRGLWGPELAIGLGIFAMIGFWGFLMECAFPGETLLEGRPFARHRQQLEVVRVSFEPARGAQEAWISGFVTNHGSHPWRVQKLEVRFLDAQNALFDVEHPEVKDSFVVPPGQDHAFRVGLGKLIWTNEVASAVARVQVARDGTLPPPSD